MGRMPRDKKVNKWRIDEIWKPHIEDMEHHTTQGVIALSSGEAEYYALVKTSSQSMGMKAGNDGRLCNLYEDKSHHGCDGSERNG